MCSNPNCINTNKPASKCGCRPAPQPKTFIVPHGYKLPIEGCATGVPVPVRQAGGNVMNCAPAGCVNPGDAPVLVFGANPARSEVVITNSPTSAGVLWLKGDGAKAGPGGLAVHPGETQKLNYTGLVAVCASNGTVTYSAVEIIFA